MFCINEIIWLDWFLKNLVEILKWVIIFKIHANIFDWVLLNSAYIDYKIGYNFFVLSLYLWLMECDFESPPMNRWHVFSIPWFCTSFVIFSGQQNVSDAMFWYVLPFTPWEPDHWHVNKLKLVCRMMKDKQPCHPLALADCHPINRPVSEAILDEPVPSWSAIECWHMTEPGPNQPWWPMDSWAIINTYSLNLQILEVAFFLKQEHTNTEFMWEKTFNSFRR